MLPSVCKFTISLVAFDTTILLRQVNWPSFPNPFPFPFGVLPTKKDCPKEQVPFFCQVTGCHWGFEFSVAWQRVGRWLVCLGEEVRGGVSAAADDHQGDACGQGQGNAPPDPTGLDLCLFVVLWLYGSVLFEGLEPCSGTFISERLCCNLNFQLAHRDAQEIDAYAQGLITRCIHPKKWPYKQKMVCSMAEEAKNPYAFKVAGPRRSRLFSRDGIRHRRQGRRICV